MTYASGGLIQATDYNGFVGTSPSSTANQINTVWAVGNGNAGYGQTALAQVSSASTVTAVQWASLINTLNSIYTHQSGVGTGLGAPTAGSLISYLSVLSGDITTQYTNCLTAATQGNTTTGTLFSPPETVSNQQAAATFTITRTVTFASADAARYFFNAGGQLNFVITSVTNNDGTTRSADMVTLAGTNFGGLSAFKATTNGGRTGTGGTVNTAATSIGYYGLTTTNQTLSQITSTTAGYTSDTINLSVKSNGVQGSNADVGTVITFTLTLTSAARPTLAAPPAWGGIGTPPVTNTVVNDSVNVTVNHRVDIVYPETTNLTNTWGTATVA
jgi:hypothetical protein